jgi:hypothetical protein
MPRCLFFSSPIRVLCCVIKENYMFEIRRGQNMLRGPRCGLQCTCNGMLLVNSELQWH